MKASSQDIYLGISEDGQQLQQEREARPGVRNKLNFVTTFNYAHSDIRRTLSKNWFILKSDPILKDIIPERPILTFRRAPTIKNIVAPSRLKQHKKKGVPEGLLKKGSYRCGSKRCCCCEEIQHNCTHFSSRSTQEEFGIKYHLTCHTSYVIYLLECICGAQYVGRTIQKLHLRINKHRANVRKGFLHHGVSRHIFNSHQGISKPFKITPLTMSLSGILTGLRALKRRCSGFLNWTRLIPKALMRSQK